MRSKFEKLQILLVHLPQLLWYVIQLTAKSFFPDRVVFPRWWSQQVSAICCSKALSATEERAALARPDPMNHPAGERPITSGNHQKESHTQLIITMGHKEIYSFTCLPITIWLTNTQIPFANSDKIRRRNIILSEPQGLYRKTWICPSPNFINGIYSDAGVNSTEGVFVCKIYYEMRDEM